MTLFCMKCDKWLFLCSLLSFEPIVQYNLAKKFNASQTTLYIVCYQNESDMDEYGYDITLLDKVLAQMKGCNERHTCFIYKRNDVKESCKAGEPICDKIFLQGLEICNRTDPNALRNYVDMEKMKLYKACIRR
jgi:hypothetical protein